MRRDTTRTRHMTKKTVTVRMEEDVVETLEQEAEQREMTRSEYLREIIDERHRADDLVDDVEQAEAKVDDLRRQLATVRAREDDVDELVAYVEEEKSLQEREQERKNAPAWTRFRYWLFGYDE